MNSDNGQLVTAAQLSDRLGTNPLVLIIGLAASGKTAVGKALAALGFAFLSAEIIRRRLADSGASVSDKDVSSMLRSELEAAVSAGSRVAVELSGLNRKSRRSYVDLAQQAGRPLEIILLDVPFMSCLERGRKRNWQMEVAPLRDAALNLQMAGLPRSEEGRLTILRPTSDPTQYMIAPEGESPLVMTEIPPKLDSRQLQLVKDTSVEVPGNQPFDAIGDVHGCYEELLLLLAKLGYELTLALEGGLPKVLSITPPLGRKLLFVGDLVDRGPLSDFVLALVMQLVELGVAVVVTGNHDYKLARHLSGSKVKPGPLLEETIAQIQRHGADFYQKVVDFLCHLPLRYETDTVIAVHAAYDKDTDADRSRTLCLYGETDGTFDDQGYPVRLDHWETRYSGRKAIVHGHTPMREHSRRELPGGGKIYNIDTGSCFGGNLTALRLPEEVFVAVPALKAYSSEWSMDEDK